MALAAAGTHLGGGEDVRIAAEFLLIHAVAIIGLTALAIAAERPWAWLVSSSVLALGTILFSADLALIGLAGLLPFPLAAPGGGFLMIFGWLLTVFAATSGILRKK